MAVQVSIVLVDSRSDKHPDWVHIAEESVKAQSMEVELVKIDNLGRKLSIGECYNLGAELANGDWVLYVGDDDYISREYVQSLVAYVSDNENIVNITSYMTAFNEKGEAAVFARTCTGMWRKKYLMEQKFNEKLKRGIDREYMERALADGKQYIVVPHNFGYFYRKHEDYSCAGDVKFQFKPKKYYFIAENSTFLDPILENLSDEDYVITAKLKPELAKEAELIWVEWADMEALKVLDFKTDAKKILRIHAYEAFSEPIKYMDLNKFDKVIFVADHIKDYVESRYGNIKNAVVIPNGVDVKDFPINGFRQNNKIAWAGYISNKKGANLLLMLAKMLPNYEFHVAGKFQEDDIAEYFKQKAPDNLILDNWQDDIAGWFQDKSYVLSTSPRESQHMTVMEGMACGLKPLLYDWIGAGNIYKPEWVWETPSQLEELLTNGWFPRDYRMFIDKNYSFTEMFNRIEKVIKEVA